MEQNFLPLDNTHNVLALLQKGYTFIEAGACDEASPAFIIGIPHAAALPEDREAQLLSEFLVSYPQVTYRVDKQYFEM